MNRDLNKLSKEIYEANKVKGFHEEKHSVEHMLCLVISELMEAVEADRKGRRTDYMDFEGLCLNKNKLTNDKYIVEFNDWIKDRVEDELADVVIRLLDTAGVLEMRLEKIGEKRIDLVEIKAMNTIRQYSDFEYKELTKYYKLRTEKLRKEKGI